MSSSPEVSDPVAVATPAHTGRPGASPPTSCLARLAARRASFEDPSINTAIVPSANRPTTSVDRTLRLTTSETARAVARASRGGVSKITDTATRDRTAMSTAAATRASKVAPSTRPDACSIEIAWFAGGRLRRSLWLDMGRQTPGRGNDDAAGSEDRHVRAVDESGQPPVGGGDPLQVGELLLVDGDEAVTGQFGSQLTTAFGSEPVDDRVKIGVLVHGDVEIRGFRRNRAALIRARELDTFSQTRRPSHLMGRALNLTFTNRPLARPGPVPHDAGITSAPTYPSDPLVHLEAAFTALGPATRQLIWRVVAQEHPIEHLADGSADQTRLVAQVAHAHRELRSKFQALSGTPEA